MRYLEELLKRKKHTVTVNVLTGYAHWAKNYPAEAHNPLMVIEEQAMLSLLPDNLNGQVCLDLACGSGRYLRLLQTHQAKSVFGLDYSADMLAEANNPKSRQGHASEIKNPKLVRSPFLALPFTSASFDLITCGLAVGHEKNLNHIMAEISRVLRPGGVVVYSDFHPFGTLSGWQRSFTTANGDTFNLEHYLHLYSDHLQACQSAGLTITAMLEPAAGEHAPPGFQQMPVVLVIRAEKTGSKPQIAGRKF
ncbi:MAG: class I SAM-dependent methyltransferase [Chloroflexi bacterium]|nr:class I SAM-dependent methyltransferase [Chloroflexota bacterium]